MSEATSPTKELLQFHRALRHGKANLAQRLHAGGTVDVAARVEGFTGLHIAASLGDATLCHWLIELGCPLNARVHDYSRSTYGLHHRATALMLAAGAEPRGTETLECLIEAGAELDMQSWRGDTALTYALQHPDRLQRLIEAGANLEPIDREEKTPLMVAIERGLTEAVHQLRLAGASETRWLSLRLLGAIQEGDLAQVKVCLSEGADPNSYPRASQSPLERAVKQGQVDVVRVLLEAGAEPNPVTTSQNDGWLPLSFAASEGNVAIVRLLLDAGADPNRGYPALACATSAASLDAIEALLASGADPGFRLRGSDWLSIALEMRDHEPNRPARTSIVRRVERALGAKPRRGDSTR